MNPLAKYRREEYISRINKVLDYIDQHIDMRLTLDELAQVAHFSRYHFHRIFAAMIGETLHQYIQRVRVEKAAYQLVVNPKKSITDIALDCGYAGSSQFSRAFQEAFKMNATQWRRGGYRSYRKNCQSNGKNNQTISNFRKEQDSKSSYPEWATQNSGWRKQMEESLISDVKIEEWPDKHVVYVRHIGPYAGNTELFGRLFEKLFKWAVPRGLIHFPDTECMSVYHDNPEVTDDDKLRLSLCLTAPEDTKVEGDIGKMTIPGGTYAVARFEILPDEYSEAWDAVFGKWLPDSGFQPDDRPSMEVYLNDPKEHPEGKHIIDIVIPVKPF